MQIKIADLIMLNTLFILLYVIRYPFKEEVLNNTYLNIITTFVILSVTISFFNFWMKKNLFMQTKATLNQIVAGTVCFIALTAIGVLIQLILN